MIWVVVANSNCCRFYKYDKAQATLYLLKELSHPELKLKVSEGLTTERPGHYQTGDSARGTYSPHSSPKEVHVSQFAREIAAVLDQGRKENAYEKLMLIATPHMYGLINHQLNKYVIEHIVNVIEKDIMHLSNRELVDFLQMNAEYPNIS